MSLPAAAAHRVRVLHALGLTSWQRRSAVTGEVSTTLAETPLAYGGAPDCVVLLPAACGVRELDLLGRALSCAGAALARAARVQVPPGAAEIDVPPARAYLACGEAQAHALGRSLPTQVTAQAQIVLVDEPARLLHEAAAKRRLWIALRTLRRGLAAAGH